jgi:hypothetical protein
MRINYVKRMNEWAEAATETRPTIAPPPTETPTRPWRPVPTKRPGEKEKSKPMAELDKVLNMFFEDLKSIANTQEGKTMIKNLNKKYA